MFTISPLSALSDILNSVTIDGTSEPGFSGSPLIVLNGADAGESANGLTLTGSHSTIMGLSIENFSGDGIAITDGASGNIIGGTTSGAGDIISGNSGDGVDIDGSGTTNNAVRGNDIYGNDGNDGNDGNGGQAIDLTNGATTFNPSPHGSDTPLLTSLIASTYSTIVAGSLSTAPNTTFEIDFFANPANSTAPSQGRLFLGSVVINTDSTGSAFFNVSLPTGSLSTDAFTTTITVPGSNTSPFAPVQFAAASSPSSENPPVASVGGPAASVVGLPVVFTSNVTDTDAKRTFTYAWSVSNSTGTFTLPDSVVTNEPFLVFTPPVIGLYTIHLTVTDDLGDTDMSSWSLVVGTPGPAISFGGDVPTKPRSAAADQPDQHRRRSVRRSTVSTYLLERRAQQQALHLADGHRHRRSRLHVHADRGRSLRHHPERHRQRRRGRLANDFVARQRPDGGDPRRSGKRRRGLDGDADRSRRRPSLSGPLTYTWWLTPPAGSQLRPKHEPGFLTFATVAAGDYQVA